MGENVVIISMLDASFVYIYFYLFLHWIILHLIFAIYKAYNSKYSKYNSRPA